MWLIYSKSTITGLASHFLLYFHMYIIYVAIFSIEKYFGNERYTTSMYAILSSFMTSQTNMTSHVSYHRVCNNSNTKGATSEDETAYPSGTPDFTVVFASCCVDHYFVYLFFSTDQCFVWPPIYCVQLSVCDLKTFVLTNCLCLAN
jgi:hypothetical protein